MSVFNRFLLAGLFILFGAGSSNLVFCSQISDGLAAALAQANPGDQISVLVFLHKQLNAYEAGAQLRTQNYSRQASHKFLVEQLRSFAAEHQSSLQDRLMAARASGEVTSFEAYWISNALKVVATAAFINELRTRDDVEVIIADVPPTALYNPNQVVSQESAARVSPGLTTIGAREMWAMGYTGQGRLVASFDTGIDGAHPALAESWRGHTHPGSQAWFDPVFKDETPTWEPTLGEGGKHGTHTMGVMVGRDDATGDTIGVAIDAEWISAKVVDVPGANYLQAFQWVADPDGDPNTIEDVPDVLNNSWGFRASDLNCSDVFWSVIDNVEALGTVVIFACGNEGPNPATIRNPANRATSPINTFAVGATDSLGDFVWASSSRGPSDCDGVAIKPEVVAPGHAIRTSTPNTGGSNYTTVSGTSFAAPHVAGAVALLRQYNPNATADEIKLALLNSATDIGAAGEDNSAGRGLINIPAALALLPPNNEVNVYIKSVEHVAIDPGMSVPVRVTLRNSGIGVINLAGTLANPEAGISIEEGSSLFGSLPQNATANNNGDPFVLQFDNNIIDGTELSVDLVLTGGAGYQKVIKLYFTVGTALMRSSYSHISDSIVFTVSNYGTYGLAAGPVVNHGGQGFKFPTTAESNLFQCGLLIGNDSLGVSDGITNEINSVDEDFRVAPGGNLAVSNGGVIGDRETYSRFRDSDAYRPLGVSVEQRTASFLGPQDANYVIMEYVVTNENDSALHDVFVGLYTDWDFPILAGQDRAGYAADLGLGYMWYYNRPDYRGTAVLNPEGVSSYYIVPNQQLIYDGVSEAEKYRLLTTHDVDTMNIRADRSYSIVTGPFNLAPGASDTAAFVMMAGRSLAQLRAYTQRAKTMYRQATPVNDDDLPLPSEFALEQNYPNPFNPVTQIEFSLLQAGSVKLEVFNSLGQKVTTLVEGERPAGTHIVQWYGSDDGGNKVASGVYFYRLSTAQHSEVRKMLLLK